MAGQGKDGVMINWVINWSATFAGVGGYRLAEKPHSATSHNAALEARVSEAGRERVFEIVRENGWGSCNAPPTHVW